MSAQLNTELMRILDFDVDDLAANRQGQITLQQRLRLLQKVDRPLLILLVLLGTPIAVAVRVIQYDAGIDQILAGVAIIGVTIFFGRSSLKELFDIVLGRVSEVTGTINIQTQVYTPHQNFFAAAMGEKWSYGVIEGVSFNIPLEMEGLFQGKGLQLFYMPRSRKALSAIVIA